jgi:hypothetical protein
MSFARAEKVRAAVLVGFIRFAHPPNPNDREMASNHSQITRGNAGRTAFK